LISIYVLVSVFNKRASQMKRMVVRPAGGLLARALGGGAGGDHFPKSLAFTLPMPGASIGLDDSLAASEDQFSRATDV
jgi:hypothetical protein